jgi:DNA-binding MarR family transcriptional regulator
MSNDTSEETLPIWFAFFTEIGIINQLSRAVFEARLPDGITLPHFTVLNHLIRVRDGQTPQKMATAFQVPKTSLTNTLAGLEARGLVEMRKNPEDGRSKQVWLTDKGRSFRDEAIGLLAGDVAGLSAQVDTEALRQALPLLEEVRKIMDKARD